MSWDFILSFGPFFIVIVLLIPEIRKFYDNAKDPKTNQFGKKRKWWQQEPYPDDFVEKQYEYYHMDSIIKLLPLIIIILIICCVIGFLT